MSRPDYQDLLRMNDAERRKLLDRVDISGTESADARGKNPRDMRKDPRWSYRGRSIAVVVEHPAGGVSRYLTTPRNISAGGLAFLHGGFLHKGSKCRVSLMKLDGKPVGMIGHVAACRHVDGNVHEIGLKFTQIIDPSLFVRIHDDNSVPDENSPDAVSVEVPPLTDDILFIDDSNEQQQLLAHQLKSTGISLSMAKTPNEAKRLVKAKPFDIILCDLNLNGYDGVDLIKSLREHGFKGPIALVTGETEGAGTAAATAAGVSHVLTKPYEPERLMELLAVLHAESEAIKKAAASAPPAPAPAASPSAPAAVHRQAG